MFFYPIDALRMKRLRPKIKKIPLSRDFFYLPAITSIERLQSLLLKRVEKLK